MVAHVRLLLCSPPGHRSCSKLCLERQIIKNITGIWAQSSFMYGSLFIFIYSLSNPTTFTWNDLPGGCCLPSEAHVQCERMFSPSWNNNLLTSGSWHCCTFTKFWVTVCCHWCVSRAPAVLLPSAKLILCLVYFRVYQCGSALSPCAALGSGRLCAGVGAASCSPHGEWGSASFLWNHPRRASAARWLLAAQAASCSIPHTRQGILEIFIIAWPFREAAWKQDWAAESPSTC